MATWPARSVAVAGTTYFFLPVPDLGDRAGAQTDTASAPAHVGCRFFAQVFPALTPMVTVGAAGRLSMSKSLPVRSGAPIRRDHRGGRSSGAPGTQRTLIAGMS